MAFRDSCLRVRAFQNKQKGLRFQVGDFRVYMRGAPAGACGIAPVVVQYIVCASVPLLVQSVDPSACRGTYGCVCSVCVCVGCAREVLIVWASTLA